jgi:hypothetical protein
MPARTTRFPTKEEYAAADQAVDATVRALLHNPLDYSKRQFDRVAMLLVVHDEGPRHMRISVDGAEPQNVPKDLIKVQMREGQFALATLLGKHVMEFKFSQGRAPVLTKSRTWAKDEIEQWRSLRPRLQELRDHLEEERRRRKGYRKQYARGRFGEGA